MPVIEGKPRPSLLGDSLAAGLVPAIPGVTGLYEVGIDRRRFADWITTAKPELKPRVIVSLGANDLGTDPEPYWAILLEIVGDRQVTWLVPTNATRYTIRGSLHFAALRAAALVADIAAPPPDWQDWYGRAYRLHRW
jgi:hypothetical protein